MLSNITPILIIDFPCENEIFSSKLLEHVKKISCIIWINGMIITSLETLFYAKKMQKKACFFKFKVLDGLKRLSYIFRLNLSEIKKLMMKCAIQKTNLQNDTSLCYEELFLESTKKYNLLSPEFLYSEILPLLILAIKFVKQLYTTNDLKDLSSKFEHKFSHIISKLYQNTCEFSLAKIFVDYNRYYKLNKL